MSVSVSYDLCLITIVTLYHFHTIVLLVLMGFREGRAHGESMEYSGKRWVILGQQFLHKESRISWPTAVILYLKHLWGWIIININISYRYTNVLPIDNSVGSVYHFYEFFLTSPNFSHILFQSYMLLNDASWPMFNTICHE
jgi:hypothetical protein